MKRTSLVNLGDRLAAKASAPAEAKQSEPPVSSPAPRRNRQPDGRKGILVRARPDAWKTLKIIALDQEMTLQDLMTAAINDILTKHGKPPIA